MCLFCDLNNSDKIVDENELCYAIFDSFAVSKGHTLIIPKRHVETYFDLTEQELNSMFILAQKMKKKIDEKYQPDGYNVGFNCGLAAGQSIMHCHMHIIPRYKGDVESPKGGIRGVIPGKQNY